MMTVDIVTDGFKARALHFCEFPWQRILAIQSQRGWLDVCRDAIINPAKQADFDSLSLREVEHVIRAYLDAKPVETDVADAEKILTTG